jgi:hypothetical protein
MSWADISTQPGLADNRAYDASFALFGRFPAGIVVGLNRRTQRALHGPCSALQVPLVTNVSCEYLVACWLPEMGRLKSSRKWS